MKPASSSSRLRRPARGKRDRSALLWGLLFFALGQVGLFALMEIRCPEFRDPEYGLKLVELRRRMVERPGTRPLMIALGSSHVGMGFRPDCMTEILSSEPELPRPLLFNCAVNSGGPLLQLVCMRRLLNANVRPDVVFVEIAPVALLLEGSNGIERDLEYYLRRSQAADLNTVARNNSQPIAFVRQWLGNQATLCYSQRSFLLGVAARKWLPRDSKVDVRWRGIDGWGFQHLSDYVRHDPQRYQHHVELAKPAFDYYFSGFRVSPSSVSCLCDLLDACRGENIRVVLVRMPEAPCLREWTTARVHEKMDELLQRLREDYQVTVCDAREWVDETGFGDPEHMTVEGADQFSRRFARDMLVPLLTRSSPDRGEQSDCGAQLRTICLPRAGGSRSRREPLGGRLNTSTDGRFSCKLAISSRSRESSMGESWRCLIQVGLTTGEGLPTLSARRRRYAILTRAFSNQPGKRTFPFDAEGGRR
jgi:hypothetical protein